MELEEHRKEHLKKFMEHNTKVIGDKISEMLESFWVDLYQNHAVHIDTDAWTNYREYLKMELKGGFYKSVTEDKDGHWAKGCRDMIFFEHKDELVKCLNEDLVKEIAALKESINHLYNRGF